MYKITYFAASHIILVAQWVEDHRAVDVDIFAQGIILEYIPGIDDGMRDIFLFLLGLFLKEVGIDIQIFDGGFDALIDFPLQNLYRVSVDG